MAKTVWRSAAWVPDRYGLVIGWHEFRGAVLLTPEAARKNRFIRLWTPCPLNGFRAKAIWKPTACDADHKNCVLAVDRWDGLVVTGWRRVIESPYIVGWKRLPHPQETESKQGGGEA